MRHNYRRCLKKLPIGVLKINTKFAGRHPWLRPFLLKIGLNGRRYAPEFSETFQSNQAVVHLVTVHPKCAKGLISKGRYQDKEALLDSKLLMKHWKYITTSPNLFKVNKKSAGRVTNYVSMVTFYCFEQIFRFIYFANSFSNTLIPVNKIVNEEVKYVWVGMKGSMWKELICMLF